MWLDLGIVLCLVVISFWDKKYREIPNGYIGILLVFCGLYAMRQKDAWHLVLGTTAFCGILLFFYGKMKGQGIGGGDIKLLFAGGLRLGFDGISVAFLLGALAGSLTQWIRNRFFGGERWFPMGPWLSIGMVLVMILERRIGRIAFF